MARSMTGFGLGQAEIEGAVLRVEMRSVNNRFREIIIKAPRFLMAVEDRIKKLISEEAARGRIEVFVRMEGASPWQKLSVNEHLAGEYAAALQRLKDALSLPGEVTLSQVAGLKEIVAMADEPPDAETLWPALEQATAAALKGMTSMRLAEGASLAEDLAGRIDALEKLAAEIGQLAPAAAEEATARIKERVQTLIEMDLDPQRLAQEAALLADKSDVTEELVRLESHFTQFRKYLARDDSIGRRLDFLVQELNREINTIGSKTSQTRVSELVVEAKAELEKIKEQVQNLE